MRRTGVPVELDEQGACSGQDPELFFAEADAAVRHAKSFCRGCPVQERCLEWALMHEEFGTWGGTTARERVALRRHRGARMRSPHGNIRVSGRRKPDSNVVRLPTPIINQAMRYAAEV